MTLLAGVFCGPDSGSPPHLVREVAGRMPACADPCGQGWHDGRFALWTSGTMGRPVVPGAGTVVVLDGCLHARAELLKKLSDAGAGTFRDAPDHELILRAWRCWGEDCVRYLLGDYAFAIVDMARPSLFLAVDVMGARQLYYTRGRGLFAFASTEEALPGLPGVEGAPNEDMIAHALVPALRDLDGGASWLRDVRVTRPGESLAVSGSGNDIVLRSARRSMWDDGVPAESSFRCVEDAAGAFAEVFGQAVRDRTQREARVGHVMSGGIDSAAIAAFCRTHGSYTSYSVVASDDAACVETACIRGLGAGASATELPVPSFAGPVGLREYAEEVWAKPHPVDNSLSLVMLACMAAKRAGESVLLHGSSGDVVQDAPLRYIAPLLRSGHFAAAWSESRLAGVNHNYLYGRGALELMLLNAWSAFAPAVLRSAVHRARPGRGSAVPAWLDRGFTDRQRLAERLAGQRARSAGVAEVKLDFSRLHARILESAWGPSLGLAGYARVGKRFGIDMRDPWGDVRVARFFHQLPTALKTRDGWTKFLARRALEGKVPDPVRWRFGKEHLGWKSTTALMRASRPILLDVQENVAGRLRPFIDPQWLRSRWNAVLRDDAVPFADVQFVHDAATIGLWLQRVSQGGPSGIIERSSDWQYGQRGSDEHD